MRFTKKLSVHLITCISGYKCAYHEQSLFPCFSREFLKKGKGIQNQREAIKVVVHLFVCFFRLAPAGVKGREAAG